MQMTPEVQDVKEEIRANLSARVVELEAAGQARGSASRQAVEELGDVGELFGPPGPPVNVPASWKAAVRRHRVRPVPAFIVGVVVAGLATTVGVLLAVLGAAGVLPLPIGPVIALTGIAATGVAWIVGDWLAHETATNYPIPHKRASGYFLATLLAGYGLGLGGLVAFGALPGWVVVFTGLGVAAAIVLFAFLGATQTNRQKAWVREFRRDQPATLHRFQDQPETATRFGIYTTVIWMVGFALFVVLGSQIGWAWSWLALLGGLVAMLITLARMAFRAR